jgi:hypothetical protein
VSNWNWDPHAWKRPTKVVLGFITVWPIVYMLFFVLIFLGIFLGVLLSAPTQQQPQRLDLIQLERKIQNNEIRELRITASEIRSADRDGRNFETNVDNQATRQEIIGQARQLNSNGRPRVEKIDENISEPNVNKFFPVGFLVLFLFHGLTILLMFLLMPLYIILAVKNERLDQTMRIVWVVLTCTVGIFANPIYWYLYIWRTPSVGSGATPPQVA